MMSKATKALNLSEGSDPLLEEIYRVKYELSAAYGHDLDRYLAGVREREEASGHPLVDFSRPGLKVKSSGQ